MSSDNTALILVAAAAVVYVVVKKKAVAATTTVQPTKNVNNTFWGSLLGSAWTGLVKPSSSGGGSVLQGLLQSTFGQTTTADGKPIGSSWADILPITMGDGYADVDTAAASGGVDYVSKLFDFGEYF